MLMKKMFSAASSAGNGLVDIHNPGSCVEARQRPLGGERKSKMLKQTIIFAAIVGLVFALATSVNAGVITQTDAIGFPSEIGPIANDDLLQSNLTSVTATPPHVGRCRPLS